MLGFGERKKEEKGEEKERFVEISLWISSGVIPTRYVRSDSVGVGKQRGARQEEADTSRIRDFLRMNPPSFTGSSTSEDPKNFVDELKKVFDVMHVANTKRVELAAYQLMNVSRTWFDQWKGGRAEDAPLTSWDCLRRFSWGVSFPEN
uniref:Retrotransposon gag protein n=1 Tax=Solanum tuberosum TaxID=4113 RepID=M1DMF2_SOLTU